MMTDPRTDIISKRLKNIHRIIAVSSGKGGVGKSMVATVLALTLARKGYRVGLFDLDFTSPSSHIILGVHDLQPEEEKGIVPPVVHGLKYMSIVHYTGESALPLRGSDVSNALIELLAVTLWEELNFLIIDMPPGISDATLDLLRLVKNIEFLVVTTPSRLAFTTVKKFLGLLAEIEIPVLGVIENMKIDNSDYIKKQLSTSKTGYWGEISFDSTLERNIGNAEKLLKTPFAKALAQIILANMKTK